MVSSAAKNTKGANGWRRLQKSQTTRPSNAGPVAQIRSNTRLQPEASDRLLTAPMPARGSEFNAETHRALGHNVDDGRVSP